MKLIEVIIAIYAIVTLELAITINVLSMENYILIQE
ncbi:hypothetical protein SDC9_67762 [bioreactor metagenome]|uniref:Uncharacterized protein n=1 Tax=bioreactor metagenome TaxID=1076179 RepID=A0A644XZV6_9ZZZZ